MPLTEPDDDREYITEEGFAFFNGIRDAAPDGRGRQLMDRAAGAQALSEFDYLVATGESRVGALAFGTDLSGPRRIVPWAEADGAEGDIDGEDLDFAGMIEAVRELDTAEGLSPKRRRFLIRGSSLGGARPKATTEFDGRQWIAKFGRADDRSPMCRVEYVTMKLAEQVGVTVQCGLKKY